MSGSHGHLIHQLTSRPSFQAGHIGRIPKAWHFQQPKSLSCHAFSSWGKKKKKGPGDHTSRWCMWLQSKHQGCWEEPSTTGFSCPKDVGKDWSGQKPNHPQVGGSCVPGTSLHQERSKKATGTKIAEHLFSHYKHCFSIFYKSVVTVLFCSSLDVLDIGLPISKVHLQQCPPAVRSCIPSFS